MRRDDQDGIVTYGSYGKPLLVFPAECEHGRTCSHICENFRIPLRREFDRLA